MDALCHALPWLREARTPHAHASQALLARGGEWARGTPQVDAFNPNAVLQLAVHHFAAAVAGAAAASHWAVYLVWPPAPGDTHEEGRCCLTLYDSSTCGAAAASEQAKQRNVVRAIELFVRGFFLNKDTAAAQVRALGIDLRQWLVHDNECARCHATHRPVALVTQHCPCHVALCCDCYPVYAESSRAGSCPLCYTTAPDPWERS
jgi:hypothetical protein